MNQRCGDMSFKPSILQAGQQRRTSSWIVRKLRLYEPRALIRNVLTG